MNKKIIALAIASAMAAPVAMADVTVSGQIGASMINVSKGNFFTSTATGKGMNTSDNTKTTRGMADMGLSQINFSGKAGDAFWKVGLDTRGIFGGSTATGRDFMIGYNLGSAGTLSAGRMPAALAGLEGDKYNATFLEMRRTAAVSTAENTLSDSFTASPILQYTAKVGGAAIKVQYDANDNYAASAAEGYYAVSVKGKAGGVGYFAGINNGKGTEGTPSNDESTTKIGASMKFGAVKATLMAMSSKDAQATIKDGSSMAIMADMGMGNGLDIGFAYGTNTKGDNDKDTFMRLALNKKLNKATRLFAGYVAKHDDDAAANKDSNALGLGMAIKF